jgi:DNA-binding transcriptional ArsR family regulator
LFKEETTKGELSVIKALDSLEEALDALLKKNASSLPPQSNNPDDISIMGLFSTGFNEKTFTAVVNVVTLPLSVGARLLLLGYVLKKAVWGESRCCFNEIASMVGISDRTAYRALKEIKESGMFKVDSRPGIGVYIETENLGLNLSEESKMLLKSKIEDEFILFK